MSALTARLPAITTLLITLAMIGSLGWLGYRFWQQEQSGSRADHQAPVQPADTRQQQPQVPLASLELFGRASPETLSGDQNTENLPKTNLKLFLRGVLAGTEEQPGSALIEDDRSHTEVYIIGDELPGNATLRSVFANRIIIERSGKLENLYFPETDDSRGMELAAVDNQPQDEPPQAQEAGQPAGVRQPQPATSPEDSEQRRQQIRRRLEELRQRLRDQ